MNPAIIRRRNVITTVLFFLAVSAMAQPALKLWYEQPARNWNEALPIGNGRLGAMIFGDPKEELLQLNEASLWSGGPVNLNPNPQAKQYLSRIRQALAKEDYK